MAQGTNEVGVTRMDRTHIPRYCLLASALVLGGILVTAASLRGGWAQPASADMVVSKDTYTVLTAQTRAGEEAVFVLDSLNETLLIYTVRLAGGKGRGRIELAQSVSLPQLFRGDGR